MDCKIKKILVKDNIIMYGIDNDYISTKIENERNFYEHEILQSFAKFISPFGVFYDIGANIGNHTLYFYKYFSPKAIYSFEPNLSTFNLLKKNVEENNLDNVRLFNIALGDKEKKVSLIIDNINLGATEVNPNEEGETTQKILDHFDIAPPDFIKIDTEGYEFKILNGMRKILTQYSPVIWVEVFPNNIKKINDFLNEFDYYIAEKKEKNYIFLKAENDEEKERIINNFIINTVIDFDIQIEAIRAKYKNISLDLKSKKQYIDNVNEKYKIITSKVNNYKNQIKEKEDKVKELEDEIKKCKARDEKMNNMCIRQIKEKEEEIEILKNKIIEYKIASEKNNIDYKNKLNDIAVYKEQLKKNIDIVNNLEKANGILVDKCNHYLQIIEELDSKNQEIAKKREKLIKRTEELYSRNNSLVNELKNLKQRYGALRASKLGRVTVLIWRIKKKIKKFFK